jgi:ABC-type antimicrobial peptide transport system permease subunit
VRARDYIRIGVKDIRRQPVRSGLTMAALAISATILVTLLSISLGARDSLVKGLGLNTSLTSILVTPNQSVAQSPLGGSVQIANNHASVIDDAAVQRIASIPHVASAEPIVSLWELKTFTVEGYEKTFVAQAQGHTSESSAAVLAGQWFAANSTAREILLGWAYAKQMGYTEETAGQLVGKTITFTTVNGYRGDGADIPAFRSPRAELEAFAQKPTTITATIKGITKPGESENQVLVPIGWTRKIKTISSHDAGGKLAEEDLLAKNGYTSVSVTADANTSVRGVTAKIAELGFGYTATQQQIERINSLITIVWGIFGAIALVSLIMACLGIANSMLTTISEQRFVIGIWRATGATKRSIAAQFIVQAGILGLVGGTLGTAAGWAASHLIDSYISQLLATQNLPPISVVFMPTWLLGSSIVAVTLLAMLAGLYPALRAGSQEPAEALSGGQ